MLINSIIGHTLIIYKIISIIYNKNLSTDTAAVAPHIIPIVRTVLGIGIANFYISVLDRECYVPPDSDTKEIELSGIEKINIRELSDIKCFISGEKSNYLYISPTIFFQHDAGMILFTVLYQRNRYSVNNNTKIYIIYSIIIK